MIEQKKFWPIKLTTCINWLSLLTCETLTGQEIEDIVINLYPKNKEDLKVEEDDQALR